MSQTSRSIAGAALTIALLGALIVMAFVLLSVWPTVFPRPTPSKTASTVIRYSTVTGEAPNLAYAHFSLLLDDANPTNLQPQVVTVPGLGFSPSQVVPSPNGEYSVALRPIEPGGHPYVIEHSSLAVQNPLADFAPGQFQGWLPDNRRFLFIVDGGGPWLVDVISSEVTQLALESAVQGAAVSPDGLTVAYLGRNPTVTNGINYALWLVDTTGGEAQYQFASGSKSFFFPGAWSPDGQWLVYWGNCSDTNRSTSLCLFSPSTGLRSALGTPSFAGINTAWSPDSQHVAVTGFVGSEQRCEGGGQSPIEQMACQHDEGHVIDVICRHSGEATLLASGLAPAWSPDGSMLAFISNRSGSSEVWTVQMDGNHLQQRTNDGQYKNPLQPNVDGWRE